MFSARFVLLKIIFVKINKTLFLISSKKIWFLFFDILTTMYYHSKLQFFFIKLNKKDEASFFDCHFWFHLAERWRKSRCHDSPYVARFTPRFLRGQFSNTLGKVDEIANESSYKTIYPHTPVPIMVAELWTLQKSGTIRFTLLYIWWG